MVVECCHLSSGSLHEYIAQSCSGSSCAPIQHASVRPPIRPSSPSTPSSRGCTDASRTVTSQRRAELRDSHAPRNGGHTAGSIRPRDATMTHAAPVRMKRPHANADENVRSSTINHTPTHSMQHVLSFTSTWEGAHPLLCAAWPRGPRHKPASSSLTLTSGSPKKRNPAGAGFRHSGSAYLPPGQTSSEAGVHQAGFCAPEASVGPGRPLNKHPGATLALARPRRRSTCLADNP